MTKYNLVNAIMNSLKGRSCGHEGSRSYCEMKKYLNKLTKAELEAEFRQILDGESVNFEA